MDAMIIQTVGLLDDVGKTLNTHAKKVRDWYGWHFPELARIISDNVLYAKSVKLMGNRIHAANLDFSQINSILEEEVEAELKETALISMGTGVSDLYLMHINELCDKVLSLDECRARLYDYLKINMSTVAPNLTALVGELVGARLISRAGSLLNLAKKDGSTIQLLGAEKALFRARRTKQNRPKYGLIYHAPMVAQSKRKHKGKMARSLAAKAALAIRVDAFGDGQDNTRGLEDLAKLEARLRNLERKPKNEEVCDKDENMESDSLITPVKTYNTDTDSLIAQTTTKSEAEDNKELLKKKVEEEEPLELLLTKCFSLLSAV